MTKGLHQYFHNENLDLAKTREDALQRQKGFHFPPEHSVIHMHRQEEPCSPADENKHEFFGIDEKDFWNDRGYSIKEQYVKGES